MTTADLITAECDAIKAMLLDKNARYGDSAMQPRRIFSRADHLEQLKVRIDDKLSRIATMGPDSEDEDTTGDLIGYLVLLRIARRRARQWKEVDDMIEPWEAAIPEQDVQRREQVAHGSVYIIPQMDDGDDDPAVVHIVPDRTSRAPLIQDVVCTACGNRFFSVSENGRRILETVECFACKDLVADGPPVRMPPETVLPLKPIPDECLGAMCGRVRG